MSLEIEDIINLANEYKKQENINIEFQEFLTQVTILFNKHKDSINLNDKEKFILLVKNTNDIENATNEEDCKNKYKRNFFVNEIINIEDVEQLKKLETEFTNFNFDNLELEMQNKVLENMDDISSKIEAINNLLEENAILTQEYKEEEEDYNKIKDFIEHDGFLGYKQSSLDLNDLKSPETTITANDLINYIKDDKQNKYPFDYNETLGNKKFSFEFYRTLRTKGDDELQKMLESIRAKNEALRRELEELKYGKNALLKEIDKELLENSNLSNMLNKPIDIEQTREEEKLQEKTEEAVKESQNVENQLEVETNLQENNINANKEQVELDTKEDMLEKMKRVQEELDTKDEIENTEQHTIKPKNRR